MTNWFSFSFTRVETRRCIGTEHLLKKCHPFSQFVDLWSDSSKRLFRASFILTQRRSHFFSRETLRIDLFGLGWLHSQLIHEWKKEHTNCTEKKMALKIWFLNKQTKCWIWCQNNSRLFGRRYAQKELIVLVFGFSHRCFPVKQWT